MKGDEFGYSPDIGKFVVRDGKTYSENGVIYGPDSIFRSVSYDVDSHENYADWTHEQRAARFAEASRIYEEYEKERIVNRDARRALVAQAKEKLTEEEFDAVLRHNDCEDRGL
jgi:hypothetical protein